MSEKLIYLLGGIALTICMYVFVIAMIILLGGD